jgi:hypothetical protein
MEKIVILNTSICTSNGLFELTDIDLDQARDLVQNNDFISAIGHDSTAQILTELLGVNIPVNRINFEQKENQTAVVFKLNGRPPEGKILTKEEIEQIGYSFKRLYKAPSNYHLVHI